MKIGIFYGSTTGNTESVAELISEKMNGFEVLLDEIDALDQDVLDRLDLVLFGIPTWNIGELEASWDFYFPNLDKFDFNDKKVAIFGLGDQYNYPDTFLDAMGILYDKLVERGANIIGKWSVENYSFNDSLAFREGKFVGLALDTDNQPELTEKRISDWVNKIKHEIVKETPLV
jgi:flavodoxin I